MTADEGQYVLITPDGQLLVGYGIGVLQHMQYLIVLEQLPTTGVTKQ